MSPLAISLRFLQTQPDHRLLELARAGHERAFEALVQRYRRQLLRYCRRLTASDASAEDVLQQGLLQAWIALSTGETDVRDPRAWLYRIVHNVAMSNLRRAMHDPVALHPGDRGHGADYEVERRLALRDALAGLASLPELQRQVILSTALDGRSHDEVAAALGLSQGAVRGLIYRARATLRAAAAALTPSPLVHWVARQGSSGSARSSAVYEALVGGGSAGLGGVLLKGGAAVVAAGALAAAGITSSHSAHRSRPVEHARAALSGNGRSGGGAPTGASVGAAVGPASTATVVLASLRSATGPGVPTGAGSSTVVQPGRAYSLSVPASGVHHSASNGSDGSGSSHGGGPRGPDGGSTGGHAGGGDGSSGSPGESGAPAGSAGSGGSGSTGGDHGGSSGGSDHSGSGVEGGSPVGSGSGGAGTTATTSGDHGGDGGSGDHGGSGSGVSGVSGVSGDGRDGGSGGGGSDGGSGGTTTTTTSTTSGH